VKPTTALFYVLVGIVLIPIVINPAGAPVAIALVVVLFVARWALHEFLDLKKSREFGKASEMRPLDMADRSDLDERTRQDMTGDDDGSSSRWRR